MKTTKNFFKLFLLFGIIFLLYFIGCRKEDNLSTSLSTSKLTVDNREYDFVNLNISSSNNVMKILGENYVINRLTVNFSESGMETLFDDIKSYFTGDIQSINTLPEVIVLYANDTLTNIDFDSVKAISFFMANETSLLQRFYNVINGDSTWEDTTFKKTCTYFYFADLDLLTILKLSEIQENGGWALFTDSSGAINEITYSDYNNFGIAVRDSGAKMYMGAASGGSTCNACNINKYGDCEWFDGHWVCSERCACNSVNAFGLDNSLIESNEQLSLNAAYDFRDNFLENTSKGQEYITYFYQLSIVVQLYKTINVSNFFQHYNLAIDMYECANTLQYGENTDIPISSALKNDLLDLIDSYRSVTSNEQYQDILEAIETDVNHFTGMTRAEILSEIE